MKVKKRVLLITPFALPNIGGVEVFINDYCNFLRKNNYQATLLTYQPLTTSVKGLMAEKKKNLTIYRFQWIGCNLFPKFQKYPPLFNFLYLTPYLMLRSWWYLFRHHREIDIVHAFGLNSAFIARGLRIFFKKKIYVSLVALYEFDIHSWFGRICRWVFKEFEVVMVGSQDSKEDVMKLGIPDEKVCIYTHWINLKNFKPGNKAELKRKLGWDDKFTVIYVGRIIEAKGIKIFLGVAELAKEVNFKIVGAGVEEERVRMAASKLPNLEFIPNVPNAEISKFFAAADLFLYLPLYHEYTALTYFESMASGTPVMSTNRLSGVYELNDRVMVQVKPEVRLVKKEILKLYSSPARLKRLAKAGVKFAQNFGPGLAGKIAEQYE